MIEAAIYGNWRDLYNVFHRTITAAWGGRVRGIMRVSILALPVLLLTVGTANAADTAAQAYGGPAGVNQEVAAGAAAGGSLPFTGLNLALIVLFGVGLVVTGLMLRRTKSAR
jgi:hypothetical protein